MATDLLERLNALHAIKKTLRFEPGEGGLIRAVLQYQDAEAHVYLHGAHVSHYQPADHRPVLFNSDASWYEDRRPIRGGVPVCFPWFGPHPEDTSLPAHGFARILPWQFKNVEQLDRGVQITLALTQSEYTLKLWPHHFIATLKLTLSDQLEMALTVINTNLEGDEGAFTIEEALHTYFAVGDVREIQVTGLEQTEYIDKADRQQRKNQGEQPITFTQETDRLYLDTTATCSFADDLLGRRITVSKEGSRSTVVWNPWIDKAANMPDFGDDEWPGMLCIETANAADNAITLKPADIHTMTARIKAEAI